MEITQPRTRIFELKFLVFITLVFASVMFTAIRYFWLESFEFRAKESTFRLAQELGFHAAGTGEINDELWKKFITRNNQTVFFVFSYKPLNYTQGFFHPQKIAQSSLQLSNDIKHLERDTLMDNILNNRPSYVNQHIHVVNADLFPSDYRTEEDRLGQIKVAYFVPGYVLGVSLGRAFQYILFLIYGLTTLSFFSIVLSPFVGKKKKIVDPALYAELEKEELDVQWIEDETGKTEPVFVDDSGKSWSILLPDGDMSEWSKEGVLYPSNEDMVARPWGSSAVRKDIEVHDAYSFQFRALKMAGQDAFIVLFPIGAYNLTWVLGGWHNTKTELAGYASTSNPLKIERNRWYYIEIKVRENDVVGLVNGDLNWTLKKTEIVRSSPENGFQRGLGIAVWGSLSRFSDIRYREEKKS